MQAAAADAAPDEVTPPLTPGEVWTTERVEWMREVHRRARPGLDGPDGQATWAVVVDGAVVGAVRLRLTDEPGVLETGIWLTRGARGRGLGRLAVEAVLGRARELGAREVRAETSTGNGAALSVLRRLGFRTTAAGDRVDAVRTLQWTEGPPGTSRAPGR